jgi:hypothetical protein
MALDALWQANIGKKPLRAGFLSLRRYIRGGSAKLDISLSGGSVRLWP